MSEPANASPRALWQGAFLALAYGAAMSVLAALAYLAPPALGVALAPALFLLVVAPVVEEHVKMGGVAFLRGLGWNPRDLRSLGALVGLGFAVGETALFALPLVNAGHASTLLAVLALRGLLTVPMHATAGWLHGRALDAAQGRAVVAIYRHGSGAAILLHAAFNGLLFAIQAA